MNKKFILFLIFFNLCGCQTNNFIDFYEVENTNSQDTKISTVKIIETQNYDEKIKKYTNKGYKIVGTSLFKGKWEPRYLAVEAAKKYGANIVITTSKETEQLNETYSTISPQPNVSYASGNVGGQNFNGTSVGMTAAQQLHSITHKIYEQKATFLYREGE